METHSHVFSYTGAVAAYRPLDSGNQSSYPFNYNSATGSLYKGRTTAEDVTRGKRKGVQYIIKVLW